MFKVPLLLRPRAGSAFAARGPLVLIILVLIVVSVAGCRTIPALPPADLQSSDWTTFEGQAVWRRDRKAPELAGELLVATRPGHAFVQFSKSPVTILSVQETPTGWEIQLPMRNKRHTGPGSAPKQLAWLHLPRMLRGYSPPHPWKWERRQGGSWRLFNARSGEFIEGYLVDEFRSP